MSRGFSRDFLIEVQKGKVKNHSLVHKFGENLAVGTTFVPVTIGGIYRTPQVAAATTLRIRAGHATDIAGGVGAQEVTLQYINTSGVLVEEPLATAGASASAVTSQTAIRLIRAFVSASGTYATTAVGSHVADIVIESSAGAIWSTITVADYPKSQTSIGAYVVPAGHRAYLLSAFGFTDSSKVTKVIFFQRQNILDASGGYKAMRQVFEMRSEGAEMEFKPRSPVDDVFVGPCDIIPLAKVNTSTAELELDFELLLVKD